MSDFSTTLLRERFVIKDQNPVSDEEPVVALSNRLVIPVNYWGYKKVFVIRAQNMHSCIRMGAKILNTASKYRSAVEDPESHDWSGEWKEIKEGYENRFNPSCWASIYVNGKLIFSDGNHHPFFDIIENCDAKASSDYEQSIKTAEEAFHRAGKLVRIDYDSNVAMVLNTDGNIARCGVVIRGVQSSKTFSFKARSVRERYMRPSVCMTAAAAYLEGFQLGYYVGIGLEKIDNGMLENQEDEKRKIREGERRLTVLMRAVTRFERIMSVKYRPEKPDVFQIMKDAKSSAHRALL